MNKPDDIPEYGGLEQGTWPPPAPTKSDDIPQDVRQQARLIYFNRCDEVSRLAAEFEEEEVVDLLIRAIMAEREACGQVVQDVPEAIEHPAGPLYASGWAHAVIAIREAIRNRGAA